VRYDTAAAGPEAHRTEPAAAPAPAPAPADPVADEHTVGIDHPDPAEQP
jgi:hypothetical protein